MGDVVVRLPINAGEEALLFGNFLAAFIERCGPRAEWWADNGDAPYVMVRSDPQPDVEIKVLIFQEQRAAQDFARRWSKARSDLTAQLTYRLG
jgi:hypothetical protein